MTCYAQSEQECWKRGGACSTHPRDPKWRNAVKTIERLEAELADTRHKLEIAIAQNGNEVKG